jgi:3-deoxy-D-manno-octulosonic-acid transferase
VSVGETRAAAPLIEALGQACPGCVLLMTHTTPTGRATGASLFGDSVTRAYLPWDLPWAVTRFLDRVRPSVGVFMETEVWPNLYAACARRGVPIHLVNARLSERSARGYLRLAGLSRETLGRLAGVAAQTEEDAARLRALGAPRVTVAGNLKFDVAPPADTTARAEDLRARFGERFVVLAASTRDGEEPLILDALAELTLPGLLLVIVPRHPQRFAGVADLVRARGLTLARRSEGGPVPAETRVFLGDSMGEMAAYYSACDLAFIGGSLAPLGGQNLIEAAAQGCPVLIGPHTWNFQEATDRAITHGAARRVADAHELAREVARLAADPGQRAAMGAAGSKYARTYRGATARIVAMLAPDLPRRG